MNSDLYGLKAYKLAMQNTKYNEQGAAIIPSNDEWIEESEGDMFAQMKKVFHKYFLP